MHNPQMHTSRSQATDPGSVPRMLEENQTYSVQSPGDDHVGAYRCTVAPDLRNWSMVGQGEAACGGGQSEKLFLKQFVDRSGTFIRENFDREILAHTLAERLFGDGIKVPGIRALDTANLVIAYEHVDVTPFDELLRNDSRQFSRLFPAVLPKLVQVLSELVDGLHLIESSYTEPAQLAGPRSVTFRGLDLRNMGLVPSAKDDAAFDLCIFDFERAQSGLVADACAKLLVSIGMLNWGRPLSRFALGPDLTLLDQAFVHLKPFSRRDAFLKRLDHDFVQRLRVVKAVNGFESAAKKLGIQLLGRRYFKALKKHAASLSYPSS